MNTPCDHISQVAATIRFFLQKSPEHARIHVRRRWQPAQLYFLVHYFCKSKLSGVPSCVSCGVVLVVYYINILSLMYCVYMCVCVCVYVFIHTHTHTHSGSPLAVRPGYINLVRISVDGCLLARIYSTLTFSINDEITPPFPSRSPSPLASFSCCSASRR